MVHVGDSHVGHMLGVGVARVDDDGRAGVGYFVLRHAAAVAWRRHEGR